MAVLIKLGKHFMALAEKYGKKAIITKSNRNQITISFIPQNPDLQQQLNQIRNSGQVCSDNWRGIEEGRLLMEVIGVLPVDELVAAIKADMEELGYEVEVLPKAEGTSFVNQAGGWKNIEFKEYKPHVTIDNPYRYEDDDEPEESPREDNIYDIGKP